MAGNYYTSPISIGVTNRGRWYARADSRAGDEDLQDLAAALGLPLTHKGVDVTDCLDDAYRFIDTLPLERR